MNESYALLKKYAESAQWDRTLDLSRELIAANPDSCDLHQSAGLAALHLGNLGEAETHLNKALSLSPGDDGTFFLLSDLWLDKGDPEKAEEFINKAISVNPEEGDYWAQYSKICYSFGDFATARELAEKAVCFEPGNADYLNLLSIASAKRGKKTEQESLREIAGFKNALKHDPENPFIYNNIGTIYFNDLKDYEKAAEFFRKALVLDPENKKLRNNLFMALGEQDGILKTLCLPRRAINIYGSSLAMNPGRIRLWFLLPLIAVISFLWIMFLLPVVKIYESLAHTEIRKQSGEIRMSGKTNLDKIRGLPQTIRILISALPVWVFWTAAVQFFRWEYALAAAFIVSFTLLVFSGLVYLAKETGTEKGRMERERNLGVLMEKKTEANGQPG